MFRHPVVHRIENSVSCFKLKYSKLPLFEKILDGLLISAIFLTFLFMLLEHTIITNHHVIHILHRISLGLAIVFVADLIRNYRKSTQMGPFVKQHWLDIVAILAVLIVFHSMYYPAIGRVNYLLKVQKLHRVTQFYHLKHTAKVLN